MSPDCARQTPNVGSGTFTCPANSKREYDTVEMIQDVKKFCQVALRGARLESVVVRTSAQLPMRPSNWRVRKTLMRVLWWGPASPATRKQT